MSNLTSFVKRIRDIMRNDAGINGDAQRIEQIAWMLFLKVYDAKEFDWEFDDPKYKSIIPEKLRWRNWGNNIDLTGNELLNFVNNVLFVVLKGKNATITDGEGNVIETIEGITVTPDTPIRQKIVQATFEDANNYMKDGVLMRQIVNIINELKFDTYEETHAFGEIYETILKELQSAGSAGEFYTPRAVTDFMAKMIKPQIGESMADFACGTGGFLTSWIKQLEAVKKSKESLSAKEIDQIYTSVHAVEKKQFPYMLCVTNMLLHDLDSPDIRHGNSLNSKKLLDYTQNDAFDVILMNPPYGGSEKDDVKNFFPTDYKSSETADLFLALILRRLKKNGRAAVIIPDTFLFGDDNTKNNIKKKLLTEFDLHTVVRMPQSVFAPYTPISTNILFFDNTEPQGKTWFYRVDIPNDRKKFSKTKPMELKHFDDCIQWWNHRTEIIDADDNPKAKCYSTQELIDGGCNLNLCGYSHEDEKILSVSDTLSLFEARKHSCFNNLEAVLSNIMHIYESFKTGRQIDEVDYSHIQNVNFSFLLTFGTEVKKAILQEAVQGRLVPQCAADGNARALLDAIRAEKQKSAKSKSSKPLPPIADDEIPFDIPDSWVWVRLGEIGDWKSGSTPSRSNPELYNGNIPWLKTGDLNDGIIDKIPEFISTKALETCSMRLNPVGSVLIAMYGATIGKVGILSIEATTNQACCACIPFPGIYNKYLFYFLMSQKQTFSEKAEGGAQPNISREKIIYHPFPLPPLAEQRRIVSAIEKLLPMCERLGKE